MSELAQFQCIGTKEGVLTCGGEGGKGGAAEKRSLGARLDGEAATGQTTGRYTIPDVTLSSQLRPKLVLAGFFCDGVCLPTRSSTRFQ